jgi:hypothetical protein
MSDTPPTVTVLNGNEPEFRFGPQARVDPEQEAASNKALLERVDAMYSRMRQDRVALDHFAEYARGNQEDPYIPNYADPMNRVLAKRATLNLISLAINIPAQISYIDGYSRPGVASPPEWKCWRKSNMDSKQTRLFISSLTYGAGYTMLSNIGTNKRRIDLLSARDTIAFYEDAINDVIPVWGLTIKSHPQGENLPGRAIYMDAQEVVHLDFDGAGFRVAPNGRQPHNLGMTPMVRWPAVLDDRGYAKGVVEDLIDPQDRVNQTAFDLLIDQSFGAYKVRTAAGLIGEPLFNEDGSPKVDADGNQVYGPIQVSQSRILATENSDAKFSTLDETPLDGFIDALDSAIKSFAVVAQLPPHNLMGSMANLSAETLQAMMSQTTRFVTMLKGSWADAARTMLAIVAKDMGEDLDADDDIAEIRWRDMSDHTLAAIVDALGKGSEMLGIPGRALWPRFPEVTEAELLEWDRIRDEERQFADVEDPTSTDAAFNREASSNPAPTPRDVFGQEPAAPAEVLDV